MAKKKAKNVNKYHITKLKTQLKIKNYEKTKLKRRNIGHKDVNNRATSISHHSPKISISDGAI